MERMQYTVDAGDKAVVAGMLTAGETVDVDIQYLGPKNGYVAMVIGRKHNGQQIYLRVAGRPALEKMLADADAAKKAEQEQARKAADERAAKIAAMIPGLAEIKRLREIHMDAREAYDRATNRSGGYPAHEAAEASRTAKAYESARDADPAAKAWLTLESAADADNRSKVGQARYSTGRDMMDAVLAGTISLDGALVALKDAEDKACAEAACD